MSILNFFTKASKPWQVAVNVPNAGIQLSEPSDRYGAIGCLFAVWEKGFNAHEARFCGKVINQQAFHDLVADTAILVAIIRVAEERGWTVDQVFNQLPPDAPVTKAAMAQVNQDVAAKLGLDEFDALEIVLRRLHKGLVEIFKQQVP